MEALWDEEERSDEQRLFIGIWANARSLFLNTEADGSILPESKAQENRKTNYAENRRHNRELRALRREWTTALASPAHFARTMGARDVFPHIPDEKLDRIIPSSRREELAAQHEALKDRFRASLERYRARPQVEVPTGDEARQVIQAHNEERAELENARRRLR